MKTRMYCIVNQYISGIHAGIQSAHAIHEMFIKYPQRTSNASNLLWDWASEDKTIIVLDGGYQQRMFEMIDLMEGIKSLPHSYFCEEEDALNGALTAVAIVLPEYMYTPQYYGEAAADPLSGVVKVEPRVSNDYRDPLTGNVIHRYTQHEKNLIAEIKRLKLKGA